MNGVTNVSILLLLACTTPAVSADDLRRNPFQPPAEFVTVVGGGVGSGGPRNLEMRVTGILLDGDQVLVSIAGTVLSPGEEVNGYRLLEASEDQAVFIRGDELLTLNLYPEEVDE